MVELFKKWSEQELEEFCDDNAIEDQEWLSDFLSGHEAALEMDTSTNTEGNLVVIIKGQS